MSRYSKIVSVLTLVIAAAALAGTGSALAQANPLGDIVETLANVADAPPDQQVTQEAAPADSVVHAFMFTRVSCEHCYEAKREILPPITEMFGDRLDLRYVYSDTQMGKMLWEIAILHYDIERPGVPMIIMGDQRFQGTGAIRDLFPTAVYAGINQGGIDWPDLPGLEYAIADAGEPAESPTETVPTETSMPEPPPSATAAPSATTAPTATLVPPPQASPTMTPSGRLGGCFSSIALGMLAVGAVLAPKFRGGLPLSLR